MAGAPTPTSGGKSGLQTVAIAIVVVILVLFAISKCAGPEGNKTANVPQGPAAAVQTGLPVQRPAQAAPVSSCSSKNRSVTAPAGGARTQWVPIPSGCGVVPGEGRGYRYGVECVNHQGSIALDGVCVGPASAERYYSKESGSVSIPVEFGPTS